MKYAIVKDGVVVNIVEYDSQPSTPPPGFELGNVAIESNAVSPGWNYVNGTFTNPNPPEKTTFEAFGTMSLTDMILANPTELAKLKQALGL